MILNDFLIIALIIILILSLVPAVKLSVTINRESKLSHIYLKILSFIFVGYTSLTILTHVLDSNLLLYFIELSLLLVTFLLIVTGFLIVASWTEYPIRGSMFKFIAPGMVLFAIFVYTNPFHQLMISVNSNGSVEIVSYGIGFIIYAMVSYLILITTAMLVLLRFRRKDIDRSPLKYSYLFIIVIFLALAANFIHRFVIELVVNPNYLFFFSFVTLLYISVFKKDFAFAITQEKSEIILDNMREMYIVVDNRNNVVALSESLNARFDIPKSEYKKDELLEIIKGKAVIYKNFNEVKDKTFYTKPYLYTVVKTVNLKGFDGEGSVILFYDETRVLSTINKLNYLRKFDQMTDLLNRNYFEECRGYLEDNYKNIGLIMLDINNLKYFNDNHGHKFGDEVIIRTAGKLKTLYSLFNDIEVYRMGGDEFLVIQKNSNKTMLKKLVSKTVDLSSFKVSGKSVNFAIGSSLKTNKENLEKALIEADKNMYREKERYRK